MLLRTIVRASNGVGLLAPLANDLDTVLVGSPVPPSSERLREGPILLVEPHFDDAVLSCWALLDRKRPLDVLTVLAGEPDPPVRGEWDRICGFTDSREAMAARATESATAFSGLPHRVSALPLLDDQYVDTRAPEDSETLQAAVRDWVGGNAGGFVALPAAAGRRPARVVGRLGYRKRIWSHPDHLFVRDALLATVDDRWTPLLYEELPYLAGGSAEREVKRLASEVSRNAARVELGVDRALKAERVAAYQSQFRLISLPWMPLDDPSAFPSFERYWLLEQ